MTKTIFLAGAGGAIGRRLAPLLLADGYDVYGTTRSPEKVEALRALGVRPIVVDVFDGPRLEEVMAAVRPEIVIHQLTDLPPGLDPARMGEAVKRNARVRSEGTSNLVAAALKSGAKRMIAQSIAWVYAPGPEPHGEDDPLDVRAEGSRGITVEGVLALERAVLNSPPLEGVVLRYGRIFGPGTGFDNPEGPAPVHVDAAASAAWLAVTKARPGIYNIAGANDSVTCDKARSELGWDAGFRLHPDAAAVAPA